MNNKKPLKANKGLTIIELMVTISIISIVAMFGVSTYSNYTTRAKIAAEVSVLTARAQEVYDLKKDGKNFYLNSDHTTVNEYGAVIKDIGDSGSKALKVAAQIMIRPESVPVDSVRWRCIVTSDELNKSSIPNNYVYGSSTFFRILKDNNMVASNENFDLENNPAENNSWKRIANGDPFLGNWKVAGGDEEIELWNDFDLISDRRDNVAELDGDSNEIIELTHDLTSENFKDMALSFDYYPRTGDDSSSFEVYLGDQLIYTQSDFTKEWQNINIDLSNVENASSQKLRIKEAGEDESYGALIDLNSLKITPGKIV